jgi:tetratricopeptide (TPR) repeat protein
VTPERLVGDAALTSWLAGELLVLGRAVEQAAEAGCPAAAWRLFAVFAQSVCRRGQWESWEHAGQTALAAARATGDDNGVGWTRLWLGTICFDFADVDRAQAEFALAIEAFERSAEVHGQAIAHTYLADTMTLTDRRFGERLNVARADAGRRHRLDAGLAHAERALALYHQAGDPDDVLMALATLVDYHALRGEAELLGRYADQAVELSHRVSAPDMRAVAQALLGYAHQARRELSDAISCFKSALSTLPGDSPAWARQRAYFLGEIAETYQALGDVPAAREAWTRALELLNRIGHPLEAQVRSRLATLGDPARG